jgi:hypothetical protein
MNLTKLETTWAEAAMGAIFPGSRDAGLADLRGMDLRGFLSQVMSTVPFQAALGLRLAIWIVALAPLLVLGRFTTVVGLDRAAREDLIARLLANRSYALRSLVLILKTIGALLYAGDDAVRARMNAPAPQLHPVSGLVPLRVKRALTA